MIYPGKVNNYMKFKVDNNLEEFISRLGDEKTKQLIALLNDVSDISVEMKNDILKQSK